MKSNNNEDIISDLTDELLLHILSFLNAKQAVQTCILSKRWINLWKTVPTLIFSSNHRTFEDYKEFLSQFLSLRDHSTDIHTLHMRRSYTAFDSEFKEAIKYAVLHNVKHLQLDVPNIECFPSCFFSCLTLTSLNLSAHYKRLFNMDRPQIFLDSLNLPSLTNLSLKYYAFRGNTDDCAEPFSRFNMLNTLIIDRCVVRRTSNLRISNAKLVNLTIHCFPKAYHFTSLGLASFRIELYYAPSLRTFTFTGENIPELFGSNNALSSIKYLNIHLPRCLNSENNSSVLLDWLVKLATIESMTVSLDTLTVLSLKTEPPSLYNLKSLKIQACPPSLIPYKKVDFLIQNSPSAKVNIIKLLEFESYVDQSDKNILTSYPLDSLFTNEVTTGVTQLEYPPHNFDEDDPLEFYDYIVGSCNGILCLRDYRDGFVLMCNPSLGKFKELPHLQIPQVLCPFQMPQVLNQADLSYGFGYDHVNDNYKVVVMMNYNVGESSGNRVDKTEVTVHTLGTSFWKNVQQEFPFCGLPIEESGKFVSGTINWLLACTDLTCRSYPCFVVSFDLENESFQEVPKPGYGNVENNLVNLNVLRDCLCMICEHDIWLMK
ncbi:hypothetical protein TSUD_117560 [Trifolium subterraneum]|nr:hypothetical protein TSUD_117560 [Trifolium subterraneum]